MHGNQALPPHSLLLSTMLQAVAHKGRSCTHVTQHNLQAGCPAYMRVNAYVTHACTPGSHTFPDSQCLP